MHCHFSRCQALGECWTLVDGPLTNIGSSLSTPLSSGIYPPRRRATSGRSTRRLPTGASAPAGTSARTWSPSPLRVERALRCCALLPQTLHPLLSVSPTWFCAVISFLHKSYLMVSCLIDNYRDINLESAHKSHVWWMHVSILLPKKWHLGDLKIFLLHICNWMSPVTCLGTSYYWILLTSQKTCITKKILIWMNRTVYTLPWNIYGKLLGWRELWIEEQMNNYHNFYAALTALFTY